MMLGLYPSQIGVRTNGECLPDESLPSPTIAQHLQRAGYQTAGYGKTHWSSPGSSTRGFDVRGIGQPRKSKLHERGATMMSDLNPEGLAAYFKETEGYGSGEENISGYVGCTSQVAAEDHRDGWVTRQCLQFLESGRDETKPLFLYVSYLKPHAGLNIPTGFEGLYDLDNVPDMNNPGWTEDDPRHAGQSDRRMAFFRDAPPEVRRRTILRYWANCSWIDSMFGQVIDKLEKQDLLDNTLILYLSDHGEMLGEHHYRFTKYCLYEASVRVPMILSGRFLSPDGLPTVDNRQAELIDILPTILDAADVPIPQALPGHSLLKPSTRKGTFSEHHTGTHPYDSAAYMWRTESAKLILYTNASPTEVSTSDPVYNGELYDLVNDPNEWTNLYNDPAHAALQNTMTQHLMDHHPQSRSKSPAAMKVKRQ